MRRRRKRSDKEFADLTQEINLDKFQASVKGGFASFPNPRITDRCLYPAWYLFLVILSGYLAGCNTIDDIAYFAELRADWFASLTGVTTIPSYNTLWWFLTRVHPEIFKTLLTKWFKELDVDIRNKLLTIDGKD